MWWASVVNAACGMSRASFAICPSFVDTVMEPDVSAIFPPNMPVFRCSLPSTGSLRLVPPFPRYYEALRLPAVPPAPLRFLRCTVPPCALGFVPAAARRYGCKPGVAYRIPHTGFIDGGGRTSQVPGGPHYERALLFDPG